MQLINQLIKYSRSLLHSLVWSFYAITDLLMHAPIFFGESLEHFVGAS